MVLNWLVHRFVFVAYSFGYHLRHWRIVSGCSAFLLKSEDVSSNLLSVAQLVFNVNLIYKITQAILIDARYAHVVPWILLSPSDLTRNLWLLRLKFVISLLFFSLGRFLFYVSLSDVALTTNLIKSMIKWPILTLFKSLTSIVWCENLGPQRIISFVQSYSTWNFKHCGFSKLSS